MAGTLTRSAARRQWRGERGGHAGEWRRSADPTSIVCQVQLYPKTLHRLTFAVPSRHSLPQGTRHATYRGKTATVADHVLAIDQGTTSTRAILFDRQGLPVAMAQRELRQFYPGDGEVE